MDFNNEWNNKLYDAALSGVEAELGQSYPLVIGGAKIHTERTANSVNPARKHQVIGVVSQADTELAEQAIQTAARTFETWKLTEPSERARYLFKAAAIMRRRKLEFSALMTLEAGKTRAEADADTAEAIDFMEFYAREMQLTERAPAADGPRGGRESSLLHPAWRRHRHSAVELPARDYGRHDNGCHRLRQHRCAEASQHHPGHSR